MSKTTLSAVILTKNEEDKISRCLESLKWADEIIIVDDLSTDRTVEICRKYVAKIISHKFQGDFGSQRNIGIDNSTGDWILQTDADEVFPESLKKEIQKAISEDTEYTGLKFRRKSFFLGHFMRYGGFYGPYSLQLFKRGQARYVKKVHEYLDIKGKVGFLKFDTEHYTITGIAQFMEKLNKYTTIEARQMFEEGGLKDKPKIRYNLTIRPLKIFWKIYIKRRGYKDRMHGFVFAVLFTFNPMLKWMKYWQLCSEKK